MSIVDFQSRKRRRAPRPDPDSNSTILSTPASPYPPGSIGNPFPVPSSRASSSVVAPSPVSFDPSTFVPEHDVVHELVHNRDAYCGSSWLSLPHFPVHILAAVHALRESVKKPSRPGLSPTATCCLVRGLDIIQSQPGLISTLRVRRRLIEIRTNLAAHPHIKKEDLDELYDLFSEFRVSLPTESIRGTKRINIAVPESTKSLLVDLSDDLGVYYYSLAIHAIVASLAEQQAIAPDLVEEFSTSNFFLTTRIGRRLSMVRSLLQALERDGGWPDEDESSDDDDHDGPSHDDDLVTDD